MPGRPHSYIKNRGLTENQPELMPRRAASKCFEDFLPREGIEFYYYDQLGCGNSDIPTDTTLWNIPRYVEEVEQVRKGLGLENFYLLGHSWGSMLAMEYLDKYQSHVKGAVLSNMTAGIKSYVTYTAKLKEQFLSARGLAIYDSLDKRRAYNTPAFQNLLMDKLYTKVVCQMPVEKWPEPLMQAFKKANMSIYIQMQGVDEFYVTGNIKPCLWVAMLCNSFVFSAVNNPNFLLCELFFCV